MNNPYLLKLALNLSESQIQFFLEKKGFDCLSYQARLNGPIETLFSSADRICNSIK